MNPWQWLANVIRPAPADTGFRAAVSDGRSGRPTYATSLGVMSTLPRTQSLELLGQFVKRVPVMRRSIQILSGFCGVPRLVGPTDAITADLELWAANVKYGRVGQGLAPWIKDHLGQSLKYGYGVGEAEIGLSRREVTALWSYKSPGCGFRTDASGEIEILQAQMGRGGLVPLNPETTVLSVNDPEGCDPNGQSLFMTCPTFAQAWLDITAAFQSTWRRCGVPVFHINWEPPAEFKDADGKIGTRVLNALEDAWNEGMKSQVVDGKAQDYFTTGKVTVVTVGADGQLIPVDISKRAIVEEIVVATGIPPWMYGYSWSTTERLSTQQADTLLAWVDCMRAAVGPGILKIVNLRQRLAGKRGVVELQWPDVNLQDLVETAKAELDTARALKEREAVARELWRNGVYDQMKYAEAVTGEAEVMTPKDEPAAAPVPIGPTDPQELPEGNGANVYDLKALVELEGRNAYPEWAGRCGGH